MLFNLRVIINKSYNFFILLGFKNHREILIIYIEILMDKFG